jgi:hypothetical protein
MQTAMDSARSTEPRPHAAETVARLAELGADAL